MDQFDQFDQTHQSGKPQLLSPLTATTFTSKQLNPSSQLVFNPGKTLTFIRQANPSTLVLPQDLYNQNAAFRRETRQGQSATEALIQHLLESSIKHSILKDPRTRHLKGLFIACPGAIEYLRNHHDVLLIDNTYRTN